METASSFDTARSSVNPLKSEPVTQAESFLETLHDEQKRFLDVIGRERSLLGSESGQLASLSAVHVRLTRQFFDAQRSILVHRAEVDAEVACIKRVTDEAAAAAVADARRQVADTGVGASQRVANPAVEHSTNGASPRDDRLAANAADGDSFARAIDEAFLLVETDRAATQRQLAALVDDWWNIEACEGKALIDDANARSAIRQHRAEIEVAQILATRPSESEILPTVTSRHTSTHVRSFLDAGDASSIASLLATLTEALEPAPDDQLLALGSVAVGTDEVIGNEFVIRLEPYPIDLPAAAPPADEAFRQFWSHSSGPGYSRSGWSRLALRVLLPMSAATSVLALFMAWMG